MKSAQRVDKVGLIDKTIRIHYSLHRKIYSPVRLYNLLYPSIRKKFIIKKGEQRLYIHKEPNISGKIHKKTVPRREIIVVLADDVYFFSDI